ncbi:MAG: inositol-3-phosphate synthase [Pirellulaceae bacterium]|jgi:myo-inositol-1-phosphate synthase|nr:inositol-3-phosphate synthase [Pirellulaceae bacterium]MDP7015565.1 inositol-3-phosphate synthase [Pirellulaceae bacterium]
MARSRIGIWLIGAHGGVATTTILGLTALRRGLVGDQGLVTQLPQFADIGLANWKNFVVGGHEIRKTTLHEEALKLANESRAIDERLVSKCKNDLNKIDKEVKPGVLFNVGETITGLASSHNRRRKETPRQAIERVQDDLASFRKRNKLDRVIVVNLASTEPPVTGDVPHKWRDLNKLLDKPRRCPLAASSLYAIAALDLECPYVNFTPSLGSAPAAIQELALERSVCHMGHDGKTGETLMKSVLAPMLAYRNLEVMSWVGHNIFGNMDGKVLDDPSNKETKVVSKDRLLGQILGYDPQTHVSIEYIESLGDWKTAWDHIHFRGFLGTPMVLQFIWQGCDSLLAAPLVLDLIRFADRAARNGDVGLMTFLASFFKSPIGIGEHDFARQFQLLEEWVANL